MKKILGIVAITVVLMAVVGCGKGEAGASGGSRAESNEVNIILTGAGTWENFLTPVFEKYEEETGIKVNAEFLQHGQLFESIEIKLGSGSSDYDVIAVDVPMVAAYTERGYISPMDEYFTADEKAKFISSAVDAGTWNGKFMAPPMNTSSQLLWYNTALLDAAGVEYPSQAIEDRMTWDEVIAMAEEVISVVDPDGTKGISGIMFEQVSRPYQMLALPNSLGAPSIGADGYTVEGVLNSPEWIEALEFYQGIFESGISLRGVNADVTGDNFRAGKTVFHVGGTWNEAVSISQGFADYGYAPHPYFAGHEDTTATPTGSWHFGLSAFAENVEGGVDLIKYLSYGEGNKLWLAANGDVPSTLESVEAIMDDDNASVVMKTAAYEAANTAVPRPVTPAYSEYETVVGAMLEDIRNGAVIEDAVNSAIEQIDSITAKYKN